MKVGFLHVGEDTELVNGMVASVRNVMPGASIWMMTDADTPEVDCDHRVQSPQDIPFMTYRMRHLAALPPGKWVILDTDVIVQRTLEGVLGKHDACLTRREMVLDQDGNNVAEWMPYNTGVMWCRNPEFWRDAYKVCAKLPDKLQNWYGDQVAVRLVAESGRYRMGEVNVDPWNYSPEYADEDVSHKAVVHYKGRRKDWMRKRCHSLLTQS